MYNCVPCPAPSDPAPGRLYLPLPHPTPPCLKATLYRIQFVCVLRQKLGGVKI